MVLLFGQVLVVVLVQAELSWAGPLVCAVTIIVFAVIVIVVVVVVIAFAVDVAVAVDVFCFVLLLLMTPCTKTPWMRGGPASQLDIYKRVF